MEVLVGARARTRTSAEHGLLHKVSRKREHQNAPPRTQNDLLTFVRSAEYAKSFNRAVKNGVQDSLVVPPCRGK